MKEKVPLDDVLSILEEETDLEVLNRGKERQKCVWEGKEPDYLPLLVSEAIPERNNYPTYNLEECFFSPEKMLYEQLWEILGILQGKSDAVPSVRVNFGTGFLVSVFGLREEVFPDKMPWIREHLTKEQIYRLTPEELEPVCEKGLLPECKRYIQFYKEKLSGTAVRIYLPDTQGVFDLAHLVLGDRIFTEFYDDPNFVQHLLTLTCYVYQKASLELKSWIGESSSKGYHSGNLYMSGCGVRSCEDTTTLLSPNLLSRVLPFLQRSLAPFGGWIHFCGDGHHLLEPLLKIPEVKGINFGNPEMYEWEDTITKISAWGKVYYGTVKREEKESLRDYFQRVLAPLKKKGNLIFIPSLHEGETAQEAIALWHQVQDAHFHK
ncbi:MAG: hypothetical protein GXO71_05570 [Caldiserica bacterium]|nr:hypothetical protein [Caldisericota bacterium]